MSVVFSNEYLNYANLLKHGFVFVETGSGAGAGIERALKGGFTRIHSIEASDRWFTFCKDKFSGNPSVTIHHGKSSDVLRTIDLPAQGLVFFLDAHPAGPLTAGHDDLMANGSKSLFTQDTIIKTELSIIFERFVNPTIVLDDMNGMDSCSEEYIAIISKHNPAYQFMFYHENLGHKHYENKLLLAHL